MRGLEHPHTKKTIFEKCSLLSRKDENVGCLISCDVRSRCETQLFPILSKKPQIWAGTQTVPRSSPQLHGPTRPFVQRASFVRGRSTASRGFYQVCKSARTPRSIQACKSLDSDAPLQLLIPQQQRTLSGDIIVLRGLHRLREEALSPPSRHASKTSTAGNASPEFRFCCR